MPLDVLEVHRIASLARLRLSPDEELRFAAQLGRVVDYIDQLQSCSAVEPESAAPLAARDAADEVEERSDRGQLLGNAPLAAGSFFVVPRVLGGGDA